MPGDSDKIWKALADKTRREILKLLRRGPLGTTEIVEAIPHLTRFGVMKHIGVLRDVGLIRARKDGTRRLNTLNVVPIRQVYDELVDGYQDMWAGQLADLKKELEGKGAKGAPERPAVGGPAEDEKAGSE